MSSGRWSWLYGTTPDRERRKNQNLMQRLVAVAVRSTLVVEALTEA
jgi:hypothetical protein